MGIDFMNGMTVRELKALVADWPEEDQDGEPTTVWLKTAPTLSSVVTSATSLNLRQSEDGKSSWSDLLLG